MGARKVREKSDPPRTRTWNLRLRRPTPYPLGQRTKCCRSLISYQHLGLERTCIETVLKLSARSDNFDGSQLCGRASICPGLAPGISGPRGKLLFRSASTPDNISGSTCWEGAIFSGRCWASGIRVCRTPGIRHACEESALTLPTSNVTALELV